MFQIHDLLERPMEVVRDECGFLMNLINRIPHDTYLARGADPFPTYCPELAKAGSSSTVSVSEGP